MSGRVDVERPDCRLHLACELLEHEVLVLHLGDEAGGLEEPLAVPAVGRLGRRAASTAPAPRRRVAEVSCGEHVLDVVDQPVVLGVEDLVDRAQRDVLVAATVTAGEVRVRASRRRRCRRAGWRSPPTACCRRPGSVPTGGVRRVVVGVLRATGRRCARCRSGTACRSSSTFAGTGTGLASVALDQAASRSRTAAGRGRAGDELAVRVGGEHRDVGHVLVDAAAGRACSAACFLTAAQVPMPVRPSGESGYVWPAGRPPSSLPVETGWPVAVDRRTRAGRPGARRARCRSGSGRPTASRCWSRSGCRPPTSSTWRVPQESSCASQMPSGPGWFWARVSTMKALAAGQPRRRCRRCRPGRA